MSQFKLDLAKLFDLQVLLIAADPDFLHFVKQMLLNLGIKKIETARTINDLLASEHKSSFDVLLLDDAVDETSNGAELVEQLILNGILANRSRLVLLADPNDRNQYAIEYPYHQVSYLQRPFNKIQLDHELKQHVLFTPILRPILTLAGLQRYQDALKLLLHSMQQADLPQELEQYLKKLRVHLLLELARYDQAVPFLKEPIAEQQGWALWALFRIRYERGDLAACQAFLQDSSPELAKYAERREVWQIYLALQQHDYAAALQVVSGIPYVGMSMNMVRLVHLILILAGQPEQALELIERKRRLAIKGRLFIQLTIAQCRALLLLAEKQTTSNYGTFEQCRQLIEQIEHDKDHTAFALALSLLKAHLLALTSTKAAAIAMLKPMINPWPFEQAKIPLLCHAAVLFDYLQQPELAVQCLYQGNQIIEQLLDNSNRVFCGCLLRHTFEYIYPLEQQPEAYRNLANLHLSDEQPRAAVKLLQRCQQLAPQAETLTQIHDLLRQLDIKRYRGINVPELPDQAG